MKTTRSFSTSTLTMKDTRSRPRLGSERRSPNTIRKPQDFQNRRRRSSNLSDIYKNPQIYAGLSQNDTDTPWGIWKKCLYLSPAFGYQICTVFTSVFSIVNMKLLHVPNPFSSLHLVIGGFFGILLIIGFQRLVKKYYGERRHAVRIFIIFTLYLLFGMILVLVSNMDRIFDTVDEGGNSTLPNSTASVHQFQLTTVSSDKLINMHFPGKYELNASKQRKGIHNATFLLPKSTPDFQDLQNLTVLSIGSLPTTPVPLLAKLLAFMGYVIMSSSLSSGHYLLLSIALSVTSNDDTNSSNNIIIIVMTASTLGACTVCLLGAVDLTSHWCLTGDSKHHVFVQIFLLLCIAMVIVISCTTCCLAMWYSDTIKRTFSPNPENAVDNMAPRDRRPTRTAQEIFDECAPLLGHLDTPSSTTGDSRPMYLSPNPNADDQISATESYSETIEESAFSIEPNLIRQYSYPVPTIDSIRKSRSWLSVLKAQRSFVLAILLLFFLSTAWVAVEYYSSIYLSNAAYKDEGEKGHNFLMGLRLGSAGVFIIYLVFLVAYVFFQRIPPHIGWKRIGLGIGLLASILTLSLALTNKIGLYFAVVCIQGALRVIVLSLPQMLTACTASSQNGFHTSNIKHIIIETPTTILWCMIPLSLTVSSAIITPLINATDFQAVPLYVSAFSAIVGSVGLITLLRN